MLVLLLFAFVSGLVTILAPCIWPLLPIVLSSTSTGGKRKPLGITLGLVFSFSISTLSISYLLRIFSFDPEVLRYLSVFVILFLGLSLLIPAFSSKLEYYVSLLSARFNRKVTTSDDGLKSGVITGIALGLVWTPCAGPILATIATLAATQSVNAEVVLVTFVYTAGVGLPLFIFASMGTKVFSKLKAVNMYTQKIQQVFGFIMVLSAILIYTGYDRILQAKLLDAFPSYTNFINRLESNSSVESQLDELRGAENNENQKVITPGKSPSNDSEENENYPKAPEIVGINNWLNVQDPLTLASLKGKVVLIDFWTYTCINCIRTLPHVTSWYEKYKDEDFVVIGVHTPEFKFEEKTENVQKALEQYNINYPVAQDNDYKTWRNFNNRYWPAKYLIDAEGRVRYTHFGEGKYMETEEKIQELLKEVGMPITDEISILEDQPPRTKATPETYLGLSRMENFGSNERAIAGSSSYSLKEELPLNYFGYEGSWFLNEEAGKAEENAALSINFVASKVFLVITPNGDNKEIRVSLDGNKIASEFSGKDVINGVVNLDEPRLYELVDLKGVKGTHLLELEFDEGIEVFAFTFGSQ
ncbi:cytochrome c biogenesis protein DipZ [Patescibacteria group bacterium]